MRLQRSKPEPAMGPQVVVRIDCRTHCQVLEGGYLAIENDTAHHTMTIDEYEANVAKYLETEPEKIEAARIELERRDKRWVEKYGDAEPSPHSLSSVFTDLFGRDIKPLRAMEIVERIEAEKPQDLRAMVHDIVRQEIAAALGTEVRNAVADATKSKPKG